MTLVTNDDGYATVVEFPPSRGMMGEPTGTGLLLWLCFWLLVSVSVSELQVNLSIAKVPRWVTNRDE